MANIDSFDAFLARRDANALPVLMSLLGTAAIVCSIWWLVNVPVLHTDAKRTEATVTKLERVALNLDTSGTSAKNYDDVPVVRFQDSPRQVEVRVTNQNHPVGKYSVGQKVTVVYRAGRPDEAQIPSFFEFFVPPLAMGGMGLVFNYSAWFLFTAIRRKRSAATTGVGSEPTDDIEPGV